MSAPSDRSRFVVPSLLAVAALALVGPWHGEGAAGRIASGVAAAAVIAAFGLSCRELGRRPVGPDRVPDWPALLGRLDRIAVALASRPASAPAPPAVDALAGMAAAIAEGRWADADALLAENPAHPDAARYAGEVAAARQAARESLRQELKAAQAVSDPDRVLDVHTQLAAVLTAEALAEVEGQVAKWFLALIMRRLRGGIVRPDVADLAARVAERFPRSVEGASLRASLATLRRSSGLCPRCARPYRGIADACPIYLGAPAAQAPAANGDGRPTEGSAWKEVPPAEDEPLSSRDELNYPEFLDDPT
jgi:hypothetical protein